MKKNKPFWSPLDNAAKIFPAIRNKEHTTVIRLSAVLTEKIVISNLLIAIKKAEIRFHYFKVQLRKGFFWYYLEQVKDSVKVMPDDNLPCRAFCTNKENKLLLRILVFKNKLSVEFSHILTDGHGLFVFLKSILIYYFNERGLIHNNQIDQFSINDYDKEEFEDAYHRYFKENIPTITRQTKAFHLPFQLSNKPRFDILYAILPIKEIQQKAQEKDVSITEYLVAVYLLVLQNIYFECKGKGKSLRNHIARIQVPVNLRKMYPSKTMRNFSLFVMPEIDFRLGKYSFEEILKIVYHKMQVETNEKLISKIISRNVGSEKKILLRGIPLWLKNLVLHLKYYSEGANQYSGVVTNLGKVELPSLISNKVNFFAITPPPPNKKLKLNCGVIGYGNKLVLSFGNISKSKEFEQKFLHFLSQQGINVKLKNKI
ncbi:hypothetical protein GCQ56_18560 [Marinifilum sp. N1E240]|uniref:hypothetical protein n=1 Tax=Marinifilum sp. N1E240 TaxID=2608082 RepID=UPI00128DBA5A|nr:hypothetical protein [Marinifilum sp. N1E240]MPQ49004.1 hypothetical protein [Marinifilum sp. N1E240]